MGDVRHLIGIDCLLEAVSYITYRINNEEVLGSWIVCKLGGRLSSK